ncbi:2-keto-4-pentenoate hydratase/2-oxohepta-3-ene-1,7-dioic acid hydratase in catechol pathway [Ancylobacter aquaticus]|uniref:2-keto-4-pentenoate hydratase/2-oxohepta-3-ene-1,7-dioic acid hydratase in catechol pathway n=1 Tax=Ancylobacter aquaticus TaxID=100 RepID=A0A4R1I5Y9_ANCAQ|nr:fumarylacetoacetate hydrolase family protein [Ancylobacter aquaticus]TCK28059.1 2-keto-4-pentenoate hydratase/2-oxohepta-3-ene-1,7-dioic acid hydratase in catechol pathway [Ancylobacter aquaticus]
MHLVTYRTAAGSSVGVLDADSVIAVRDLVPGAPDDMISVIEAGDALLAQLAGALKGASASARTPLATAELLCPIPQPGKVICLGLNYALHAKEGGNAVPDYPAFFIRTNSSLVAPNAPVLRPKVSDKLDYECELTIVIGKRGHDIPEAEALSYVYGYTILNDVSVRDYQRKTTQWSAGKNFDGTGPLGPVIATADSLPAGADGLGIRTRLNGEVMQDSVTSDMVFKTARTVALMSEIMTLNPGDVIATGTPSGVGYARKPPVFMKHGDVVEIEIDGIGILRNPVVDA